MIPEEISSLPISDDPRIIDHQQTETTYAIKAGGSGIDAIEITNYMPRVDIGDASGDFKPDISLGAFFHGEISSDLSIKQPDFSEMHLAFAMMITARNGDRVIEFSECSFNGEPHHVTIPDGKSAGFMFGRMDHYYLRWCLIDDFYL